MRPYLALVPAVLLAILAVCPTRAHAEPRLGKAWESPILEGIERQELDLKERRPETILRQAELLAARRSAGPTQVARVYLLARAYVKAGDGASGETTYREVLKLAPDCYFVFHDLAMVQLMRSPPDMKAAERYLRRAVQIHVGYATAWRKLASLLIELKRPDEAVRVLRRVVELEPASLSARYRLADILLTLKRMDEAEREIATLLRKEPRNPLYKHQRARFYLQSGNVERALKEFRELAQTHPDVPQPVQGYIRCLTVLKDQGQVDAELWLWALERLYRLTRDPAEKERLLKAIEDFRRLKSGVAPPVPSEGPPTDAQAAEFFAGAAKEEQRIGLLQWVYGRAEQPEKVLWIAIVAHVDPAKEPSAKVRQWVLRVLGRRGGGGMSGIVRHSLGDPAAEVRTATVDALMALAATGEAAHGTALLALGQFVESRDAVLASAARAAVTELAKATLPPSASDTLAGRRAAFLAWWKTTGAAEARVTALHGYGQVGDAVPEGLLLTYLADADAFVAAAAWEQMAAAAKRLCTRGVKSAQLPNGLDPARHAWLRRLPTPEEGVLRGPQAAAARARLSAWAAQRPR